MGCEILYATVDDFKAALPDLPWTDEYDGVIDGLLIDISREIDEFTGREPGAYFVTADSTRYFSSRTKELWVGELAAAPTSVAVDLVGDRSAYTAWTTGDYDPWPYNAVAEKRPFLRLDVNPWGNYTTWYNSPFAVKIVGKFGYSTEPPEIIKRGTLVQAIRWFKRAQQGFEDVGAMVALGQLHYVQGLDPAVKQLIEHTRRITV